MSRWSRRGSSRAATVKVDGSAAYVAGESADHDDEPGPVRHPGRSYGGTDDTNGIVHTGSTTGGDTASLSDNHKIYMVAVPKNQALTMLLGGTVGFDANVAGYDNGQIVLGAGWSIYDAAGTTPLTAIGNEFEHQLRPGRL